FVRRYLYVAEVRQVVGAFPWRARAGDRAEIGEYVQGDRVLNLERSEHEMGWSLAEPVSLDQVASWAGRRLASIAPAPAGLNTEKPMLLDAAGKATL
ncbi:DUF4178 domain-containing protein, partial [Salmonella enterica subsp. enterica serovar Typhimurium]|nr:DUF4178 domain-containing protein [Salmonella enterica subsp. enterica serovar Typhimurium]